MVTTTASSFLFGLIGLGLTRISIANGRTAGNGTDQDHLIWSLLESYNMHARPTVETVNVSLAFYLESIDKLEEREQILHVSAYLEAKWTDRRLIWNSSDWEGVEVITLPADMIWKPDFALINSAGDIYNSAFYSSYYLVEVSYDGAISWTPFGQMAVRCVSNLTYYPFDTQKCHFRFENWVYRSSLCRLHSESDRVNLDSFIGSGEWSITNTSAEGVEVYYEGFSNYSDVYFNITMKRKTLFYTLHVIFPSALLSVLMCFVFVLPAESEEKVSLNITLLLSFVVLLLNVSEEMPKTSDYTPLLSRYITLITSTSAISLICTIYVIRISKHGSKEVPRWVQLVFVEKLGRLLCVVPRREKYNEVQAIAMTPSITVISHSQTKDKSLRVREPSPRSHAEDKKNVRIKADPILRDILCTLKEIEQAKSEKHKKEVHRHHWIIVGLVIDRIFFYLFSLATLLASLVILVLIPM